MRFGLHSIQLLIVGVAWVTAGTQSKNETTDEELKILDSLAEESNKFAIALYRAISQKATSNVVVSPVSLQLVLALAYCGAQGKTASEISQVLGLSSNLKDVQIGHKLLIQDLQNPVLKIANKMFLEGSFEILEGFQSTAKDYFLSAVQKCDFPRNPEQCRKIINSWVEDNTNNKIKDLLLPGMIDSNTKLVLTNAVHFKADWEFQFRKWKTRQEPFHVTPTQEVSVDMMHLEEWLNFKHSTLLGAKILELPYKNREFQMIFILPDAIDGLSDVEDKLLNINLAQEISNLDKTEVKVALPKFKLEETMDLNPILKEMGITTMFGMNSDFSGISEGRQLRVSQVVQKTFMDVNEMGTEAAAATGGGYVLTSIRRTSADFKADHPFLMLLTKSGRVNHVLFVSRYSNPK